MQQNFDRRGKRKAWIMARGAESNYSTRLRQVAKQIDLIVRGLSLDDVIEDLKIIRALRSYADLITPWAESVASYMVADVGRRSLNNWIKHGDEMSKALRVELTQAPTGRLYTQLMQEQVTLIRSLPLEAANRVHTLTTEGLMQSRRPESIAKDIRAQGGVSAARARLIARTEVSRTASNLTQARAQFVGSEGYIWRTSNDTDVRHTHKAMNGKYVRWDSPPKTDKNLDPYHAGCGPNCRCYPDPILPEL